jgi:hypothetical protein
MSALEKELETHREKLPNLLAAEEGRFGELESGLNCA